jgi:S-adenosylmethionine/arginine decarboxylase-like enzyme
MDVDIQGFCEELAELVDMQIEDFHIWASSPEDEKDPKTFGQSAIQFILTSNITVHVLPLLQAGSVYVNLFSCKPFDADVAAKFIEHWFEAKECRSQVVERI